MGNVIRNNMHRSSSSKHDAALNIVEQQYDPRSSGDSRSYTFQLPNEILEDIFIHCAADHHNEKKYCDYAGSVPDWVNVSYICRHWRRVALNCSILWTYLFITSPRWTEELLARSQQAPLKVRVDSIRKESVVQHFVEQVMDHVERVQELYFDLWLCDNVHDLLSKLPSRAPCLRTFGMSMNGFSFDRFQLPFDGDTPALRSLEVIYCHIPWYSFKLGGLTTLSLYGVPDVFQQDTVSFLATLGCMQDLTELYLDRALASTASFISSAAFRTFQKINLPRLSRLSMFEPVSAVITLLSCVRIPSTGELRLHCFDERGVPNDHVLLSSLVARRFWMSEDRTLSNPTVRSLMVKYGCGMETYTFSTLERDCNSLLPLFTTEWGDNIPLRLTADSGYTHLITDHICRFLSLTSVQSVHVTGPSYTTSFWRQLLDHLPNLRYLKVSDCYMPDLASLLSLVPMSRSKHLSSTDQGLPVWGFAPRLEELELHNVIFPTTLLERSTDPHDAYVPFLCNALAHRRSTRGQLTVTGCRLETGYEQPDAPLDMTGRWIHGRFHVVERK